MTVDRRRFLIGSLAGLVACGERARPAATSPETSMPTTPLPAREIVELRQYTLHPGTRETLLDVFERHFLEGQETTGMRILGQFRDAERPDMFVWLRSFPDMERRRAALEAFYTGPVWRAHRETANSTMIDASNVLLLRPAPECPAWWSARPARPPVDAAARPGSVVFAAVHPFSAAPTPAEIGALQGRTNPVLAEIGARPLAWLQTEYAENTFPKLPVRTGEHVAVWLARFDSAAHYRQHAERLAALVPTGQRLVLQPGARSWLC